MQSEEMGGEGGERQTMGNVSGRIQDVRADLSQLRDDLAVTGRDIASAAQAGVSDAREAVVNHMQSAKDRGSDLVDALIERVEERPLASLAIALGTGMVLGMLWRRS